MAEVVGALLIDALIGESFIAAGGWAVTVAPATLGGLSAGVIGSGVLIGGALVGGALVGSARPSETAFAVPKPSDGTQNIRQAISPRIMGYGRARLAGAFVCYEAGTNGYSYDILALHEGRIEAVQLYYLHDDLVTINTGTGGFVTAVVGSDDGRYVGSVVIQTRLGNARETAYGDAVTGLTPTWTDAFRGDGVASVFLRCAPVAQENYYTVYPRGLPAVSVVADLSPVFDPRDTSKSRADPHLWRVSRNPVLQLIHYLTDPRGLGLDWDEIIAPNLTALMAQADICDEQVTKVGGTEPRYQSSGWFYLTTDPADVIASILATCDGWMAEAGDGTITIQVGKYSAPTLTFTDDHIIGFTIDHGVPDEEAVNEIKFSYNAPDNDYREAPGTPWRDEAAISESGQVRSQNLSLTWVQSHSQARRLAKRAMARHQARLRGSLVTTLYGMMALGKRWVGVQSNFIDDLTDAVIEITRARVDIANARVSFDWVLVNPNEIDAWDAATEEGYAPVFPGKITLLPLYVPTNVVASGISGSRLQVVIDDPNRPDLVYAVEYRIGSGTWTRVTFTTYTPSAGRITLTTAALPAATYNVGVASIGTQGSLSSWSSTVTATVT